MGLRNPLQGGLIHLPSLSQQASAASPLLCHIATNAALKNGVRYRGLAKNAERLALLFGLGNLLTAGGRLRGGSAPGGRPGPALWPAPSP